jgi:ribonuclease BN (tRNA processing enzyme)
MNVRLWGTRGSIPAARPGTIRYGGNTSCVEIRGGETSELVILDAGTGICSLAGAGLAPEVTRVDILLTHLHMDHILGLGFFDGLFQPGLEVHIWGPASLVLCLRDRLTRYLSPPLFPVRLRELPCRLSLHDVPLGTFDVPGLSVRAALICHPGPTVGYRLEDRNGSLAYLPDHEPALGVRQFPDQPRWTSGHDLADGADVLIHDAQYDDKEYATKVGWGHSSVDHTYAFARAAGVRHLVPFHHDPRHDDSVLDQMFYRAGHDDALPFTVSAAKEGQTFAVG